MASASSKSDKSDSKLPIIISAAALVVAFLGYLNSRETTKQSIDSDHRSQRAWLQIYEPRLNAKDGVGELNFALKNEGKTPALKAVTEEWYTDEVVTTAIFAGSSSTTTDPAVSPAGDPATAGEHQKHSHGVIAAGDTVDMTWRPPKMTFAAVSFLGGKSILRLRFSARQHMRTSSASAM
jgi:hypothetical protein